MAAFESNQYYSFYSKEPVGTVDENGRGGVVYFCEGVAHTKTAANLPARADIADGSRLLYPPDGTVLIYNASEQAWEVFGGEAAADAV